MKPTTKRTWTTHELENLLWTEAHDVARQNPHDGRTAKGITWDQAIWLLAQQIRAKLNEEETP